MYTRISCPSRSFVSIAAGFLLFATGCNVDRLWMRQRTPEGATLAFHDTGAQAAPVDIAVADSHEVDLVEQLVTHRLAYRSTLARLRKYYSEHGYSNKETWAAQEMKGLRSVQMFRYLMDAEIPQDQLRPAESIAEADALYEKGLALMKEGGHGIPVFYRQERMIEAARVFRDLIERYPQSDKIDDAAFMCGEIHKEYLPGQEQIAVEWYERAWTWNPHTPHAARFQAAVVYDYRLHDRDRALELYKAVVKDESDDRANLRFATRRISELTADYRMAHADRRSS